MCPAAAARRRHPAARDVLSRRALTAPIVRFRHRPDSSHPPRSLAPRSLSPAVHRPAAAAPQARHPARAARQWCPASRRMTCRVRLEAARSGAGGHAVRARQKKGPAAAEMPRGDAAASAAWSPPKSARQPPRAGDLAAFPAPSRAIQRRPGFGSQSSQTARSGQPSGATRRSAPVGFSGARGQQRLPSRPSGRGCGSHDGTRDRPASAASGRSTHCHLMTSKMPGSTACDRPAAFRRQGVRSRNPSGGRGTLPSGASP